MHLATTILSSLALFGPGQAASSSGCGKAAPASLNKLHNVTVNGSDRTFLYWLPPSYDASKPSPLIFSFHGASKSAKEQAGLDLLTTPFFNTDHIVVYPLATVVGGKTSWQGSPKVFADDVGYTLAILKQLQGELCIDTDRVYATGKSQGAGFVGVLACNQDVTGKFAAFAPVSGAFYINTTACSDPYTVTIPCASTRASTPMMEFHGGADGTINITGGRRSGECLPAVSHWVAEWARRDGLPTAPTKVTTIDATANATRYEYGSGDSQGLVTWFFDGNSVGHFWPATITNDDNGGDVSSFNASSYIMKFFNKYSLS